MDEPTKRWVEEFERDDEAWHEFRRRRLTDEEPIRMGDLSTEALQEIEKSVEKSREGF